MPVFPGEHDAGGAGPGAPVPGGGHGSDSPAAGGVSGQGQVPAAEDGVPVWRLQGPHHRKTGHGNRV